MNILVTGAATSMAAKRSAYSLAREVLVLRAELAAARAKARKVENLEAEKAALTEELEHAQGQRDTAIQRAQVAEVRP